MAIDPIGYIAPIELDIARYIRTELTDGDGNIKEQYEKLVDCFSTLVPREKLETLCFVDMVFRLHNSLFENENYNLTDKWLNVLEVFK